MILYILLIVTPFIMSVLILKRSFNSLQTLIFIFASLMSLFSILLFIYPLDLTFSFNSFFHTIFIIVDIVLIGYFLKEGFKFSSSKVWVLASLQLILFIIAESILVGNSTDLIVDELSCFMFTVINIVGSLIIVFALWYINKEDMSEIRKKTFLVYLCLFLVVMNLIVITNSLMIFFLLFEMTTLASYLLIGFRKDEIGQKNALKALWMNQIGGILILLSVIFSSFQDIPAYFTNMIESPTLLLALSLLALAALIKGAQTPFDSWLLGAMVAPTPVSAILHSATMVKIAPFVILKLSSSLENTIAGDIIIFFGSFVFLIAALYGLSREKFKEILGYSTISLLGLMCAMAVCLGTTDPTVVYILIFFHAVSKALLFLLAGILEKKYHIKEVWQMDGLLHKAPLSASMIIFGFASITLPPFGLFFGKLFSIEISTQMLEKGPAYLALLIALALGSAILTLLYFKVASLLFSKQAVQESFNKENKWDIAMLVPYIYTIILIASVWFILKIGIQIPLIYVFLSLLMIILVPICLKLFPFKNVDRVKEYYCAEQEHFSVGQWSFEISQNNQKFITSIGIFLFFAVAFAGGVL